MTHFINRIKKKINIITSIDAEKFFRKIQYPFIIENFNEQEIKRNNLNIIKSIYNQIQLTSYVYYTSNGAVWNYFSLNSRIIQGYLFSPPLFNIVLEFLGNKISQ